MSSDLDATLVEALQNELRGREVHATRVENVTITRGLDADGNPALFVELTLSDPPEGAETWPSDDVFRLRREVREAILRMLDNDVLRWYVNFDTESAQTSS